MKSTQNLNALRDKNVSDDRVSGQGNLELITNFHITAMCGQLFQRNP